jgi:hypothetical protein
MNSKDNLEIFIYKASFTVNLAFFKMDPYFRLELSQTKYYQSPERKNEGKFPIFNELVLFEYENEENLNLSFYHKSKLVRPFN